MTGLFSDTCKYDKEIECSNLGYPKTCFASSACSLSDKACTKVKKEMFYNTASAVMTIV